MNPSSRDELFSLLESLCEERLDDAGAARLEHLVLSDPEALRTYVDYMSLHGLMYFDAAAQGMPLDIASLQQSAAFQAATSQSSVSKKESRKERQNGTRSQPTVTDPARIPVPESTRSSRSMKRWLVGALACSLALVGVWLSMRPAGLDEAPLQADRNQSSNPITTPSPEPVTVGDMPVVRLPGRPQPDVPPTEGDTASGTQPDATALANNANPTPSVGKTSPAPAPVGRDVVATINRLLAETHRESGVQLSPRADDSEWLRRVSLDLCGRIPDETELQAFLADKSPVKREAAIERLLNDPAYARHFSTVWTNLLVGRSPARQIDRDALARFLRDQFWNSRPWTETVTELVAAEGTEQDNGAASFLMAHLNNQAVPATAITARILLCSQVQCSQCHLHPTVKDWGQEQFWQLNAFFQGTRLVETARTLNDGRRQVRRELVSQPVSGPIYFETLNGVMRVAYPKYDGKEISPEKSVSRRRELARLMSEGDSPQLAAAFVNRLWAQLFRYGFTNPIDDMGPHHPPTHPELLDYLTRAFVASGYDVRQLLRWMCQSDLYQSTSRAVAANEADDPENGSPPLFSRMYVKTLTAEQLFDSLLVATSADLTASSTGKEADQRRKQWLAQFYSALDNDENTETTTFDGSLPQALVMMNGDLIREAISGRPGTFLNRVQLSEGTDLDKLSRLSMAILSRAPTPREEAVFRQTLKGYPRASLRPGQLHAQVMQDSLQDVCWAYLNSTEFVVNR